MCVCANELNLEGFRAVEPRDFETHSKGKRVLFSIHSPSPILVFTFFAGQFGAEGHGTTAFQKLKILLDRMMLRRTKVERADDLGLPPRTIMVRRDFFTEEEEELYASLYTDVKRKFSTFVQSGTVLNKCVC